MVNRTDMIFTDARVDQRVKDNKRVAWQVREGDLKGQGKVRNISTSGMLLETNSTFKPTNHCVFSFDADLGSDNYIPQTGRLVWYKRKSFAKNQYLCGIKFVDSAEYVSSKLNERVQKRAKTSLTKQRLSKGLDALLFAGIIGLTGYTLWMSAEVYQDLTKSNQRMLSVSQSQAILAQNYARLYRESELKLANVTTELNSTADLLQSVSKELEATKAILTQTEVLLSGARTDNSQLKSEVQSIKEFNEQQIASTKAELEGTIALLQEKNGQLELEMKAMRDELIYYKGDIRNTKEGRALLKEYHENIKAVKSKIKGFKQQAWEARQAALNERDRIRLLLGNNGYFMKDGQDVRVDMEQYEAAGKATARDVDVSPANKDVEINVTFFE